MEEWNRPLAIPNSSQPNIETILRLFRSYSEHPCALTDRELIKTLSASIYNEHEIRAFVSCLEASHYK